MSDGRLLLHVAQFFPSHVVERQRFDKGPVEARIPGFEILIVQPKDPEDGWRYLSDGARDVSIHDGRNEYLLEAPSRDDVHLETLSMVANFHAKQEHGGVHVGRILDIGRPWVHGASCDHLQVSLPYTLGPDFERVPGKPRTQILWLVPITKREADFARTEGVEALEQIFEREQIDTLDPTRISVV